MPLANLARPNQDASTQSLTCLASPSAKLVLGDPPSSTGCGVVIGGARNLDRELRGYGVTRQLLGVVDPDVDVDQLEAGALRPRPYPGATVVALAAGRRRLDPGRGDLAAIADIAQDRPRGGATMVGMRAAQVILGPLAFQDQAEDLARGRRGAGRVAHLQHPTTATCRPSGVMPRPGQVGPSGRPPPRPPRSG